MMQLINHARTGLARLVRDRQLYVRLQVGSALALGVGLFLSAVLVAGFLEPLNTVLAAWLFDPAVQPSVTQDRLTEIVVLFLVALLVGATVPHLSSVPATALTLLYVAMYLSYAYQKLSEGIRTRPLYPLVALFLTLFFTRFFRYLSVERRRRFISRLFHQAVPPDAVERVTMVFDTNRLPLHGIRRKVTVLYVDLRDLRWLTESLEAEAVIALLNRVVEQIVAIVFEHDGFITKQAGDTTLAVWNLVLDQPDHALRAARAALDIKRAIRALIRTLETEERMDIGVGVATGYVVAGRIATARLAEFAIIGEVVTLAERMAMKTDRGVFVDPLTRGMIHHEFDLQEVNPVRLRRKTDPHQVWEIVEPMELEPTTTDASTVAEPM